MNFVRNERMVEIDALMAPLEEKLDRLRVTCPTHGPAREKFLADIRQLRTSLGKLGREYWAISLQRNPAWHSQAPCWKKQFPPSL